MALVDTLPRRSAASRTRHIAAGRSLVAALPASRRVSIWRKVGMADSDAVPAGPDAAARLGTLEDGTSAEAALEFFDSLPPVPIEQMFGAWRGAGLDTGNPLDGLLEGFCWHGKRFDGPEEVHPLVFDHGSGPFSVNPAFLPMGLVVRYPRLLHHPALAGAFRRVGCVMSTRKPQARLRTTVYRGVATATMCYDRLPVHDVFRKIDDDTVLGVMDMRAIPEPFIFVLRREPR
jgi:hypothetical protein